MKKHLLTLLTIAGFSSLSYGQVSVDWSVDQILTPTSINSAIAGTQVPLDVVLKNNGTDSCKIGDSVYLSFYVAVGATAYIYWPTSNLTQVGFIKKLTKNLKSGDTIHFTNTFTSGIGVYPSQSATIRVTSIILNRPRGLGYESTSSAVNNSKSNTITWYNIQGWPVSVKNTVTSSASIAPTVVSESFTTTLNVQNVNTATTIQLFDLTGREVMKSNFAAGVSTFSLSAEKLTNGTYIAKIVNGDLVSSTKIVVQK